MSYNKLNERVRTPKMNAIFGSIPILRREISEGNFKHKKWRTDSSESILGFSDPILQKFKLY